MRLSACVGALFLTILPLLFLCSCSYNCNRDGQPATDQALSLQKKFQVLYLSGAPYERGVKHGKTLKGQIKKVVNLWKSDIQKEFNKNADDVIKKFIEKTNYIPAIKKWTPDLYDEISGIADGSGLEFNTIFAFQLMDEFWVNVEKIDREEHCSSLGFQPQRKHSAIIAQNMDLEYFRDGYQVLLHIKYLDSKLESYVLTCAGLIGLNGMNNSGIGICCNALGQLSHCRDGLPVSCVIRGVLQKQTKNEAIAFIKAIKHASGQNYVIGSPEQVCDFECSSNKVCSVNLPKMGKNVWHTSHPLSNNDYGDECKGNTNSNSSTNLDLQDSRARLTTLEKNLTTQSPDLLLDRIKKTLRSRESLPYAICRLKEDKQDVFTFVSTIMILSKNPELLVSMGPPDSNPYEKFIF